MKRFFLSKWFYVVLALLLAGVGIALYNASKNTGPAWVTDTVSRGAVAHIVSVSGTVEAEDTAELSFPTSGIVSDVFVDEGDAVVKDQVLAALEQAGLQAERLDAIGALHIATADRDELIRGPRSEERDVTNIAVSIAEENLSRTIAEEARKVENTYRTLLSDGLEAFPIDTGNSDVPPTITGTYTCATGGAYTLSVYNSNAQSGYSYRLSGLESGIMSAFTDSPAPLGTCGLFIQFDADENYSSKDWLITIPNTRASAYTTNLNAYLLAKKQEENAVAAATQALEKARREQVLENAIPREEALIRAEATVAQAEARLGVIDARIADRTLHAPFSGTINNVNIVRGETVDASSAMTIIADGVFELTARIPEIDITRISVGAHADIIFDARPGENISSTIAFVSPLATELDGVAYFEAKLRFDTPPAWLRGGLNADVDIISEQKMNVLRVPKRFIIDEGGVTSVLVPQGDTAVRVPVTVGFLGNDGYVEITGLSEGDTVIAP